MRSIPILLCLVLLSVATLTPLSAMSLETIDPFETMDFATVDVLVGDSIDATGNDRERLFGSFERRRAFEARLRAELAARLQESGIVAADKADGGIKVGIYGHAIPATSSGLDWVFYIDFLIWDPRDADSDCNEPTGFGRLGAVGDAELEEVLSRAVLGYLDERLGRRDAARTKDQEPRP